MLELRGVDQVVDKAASSALTRAVVSRVFSKPTIDSEGREALNVTVVLKQGKGGSVSGDAALSAIVRIQHDLRERGEERFPIVYFATEEELEAPIGDTES